MVIQRYLADNIIICQLPSGMALLAGVRVRHGDGKDTQVLVFIQVDVQTGQMQ